LEFRDIFRYIVAIGGSLVTYLFGGWSALIKILVAFVVIDYVTGVLAAAYHGKLEKQHWLEGHCQEGIYFHYRCMWTSCG